jgi:hypothetical protein
MKYFLLSSFLLFVLSSKQLFSQETGSDKKILKLGFNYGQGKQETFPFNSPDYTYDAVFYKFQFNYGLFTKGKWIFELNAEPALYVVEHQLLNKYYVRPDWGDDYLEKREEFTQKKTINEYVINFGFLSRYIIFSRFSVYALGSIGPMFSDTDTERMSAGFAFSDIFALGSSYQIKRFLIDFRYSLRHVSNANIRKPNNGYNSANLEFGLTYQIN